MRLDQFDSIVVKVGSSLLVDHEKARLRTTWMHALCDDIEVLKNQGKRVTIVSSGAIATARVMCGYTGDLSIEDKRAAAAEGQPLLMTEWRRAAHYKVAQVLVTTKELNEKTSRDFLIGTLKSLHARGTVPVINENDAIATDEIVYGDNDRLAAHVAANIRSQVVVLLSDIDGLFTADPRKDKNATLIPHVTKITHEIIAAGGGPASDRSKGGMESKIKAAQIAQAAGVATVITKGEDNYPLRGLSNGKLCTWFTPS